MFRKNKKFFYMMVVTFLAITLSVESNIAITEAYAAECTGSNVLQQTNPMFYYHTGSGSSMTTRVMEQLVGHSDITSAYYNDLYNSSVNINKNGSNTDIMLAVLPKTSTSSFTVITETCDLVVEYDLNFGSDVYIGYAESGTSKTFTDYTKKLLSVPSGGATLDRNDTVSFAVSPGTYQVFVYAKNNTGSQKQFLLKSLNIYTRHTGSHEYTSYTPNEGDTTHRKSAATCTSKAVWYKRCKHCGVYNSETFEYGSLKAHSYASYTPSGSAGRYSAATCTSPAKYYKKCSVCGVQSTTETFDYGSATGHNYNSATFSWPSTINWNTAPSVTATYKCANCSSSGTATVTVARSSTTSSITYTATAYTSSAKTTVAGTDTRTHSHTWSTYTPDSDTTHRKSAATCTSKAVWYKNCNTCGNYSSSDTFTYGELLPHSLGSVGNWLWNDDRTSVSARAYCKNCSYSQVIDNSTGIAISSSAQDGVKKYTASYTLTDGTIATNTAYQYLVTFEKGDGIDSVSPSQLYMTPGSSTTVVATVSDGCSFAGWTSSNSDLIAPSTDLSYTFRLSALATGPVTLTASATENTPVVTSSPEDVDLIEGQSAIFSANGAGYKTLKWQQRTPSSITDNHGIKSYSYDGSAWSDMNGETASTLQILNTPIEKDGYQYRLCFLNVSKTAYSEPATLRVASNAISFITAEYGTKKVDFGDTIRTKDLILIVHYINNSVALMKNMDDGLSIRVNGIDKTSFSLNRDLITSALPCNVTYTAVLNDTYEADFTITVMDRVKPVISTVTSKWGSGEAYVSGATSCDMSKNIILKASATDNYSDTLSYRWFYNGVQVGSTNELSVNANGTYEVEAEDEAGNISDRKSVNISAYDTEAPYIYSIDLSPSSEWAKYRNASVRARDNVGIILDDGYAIAGPFEESRIDVSPALFTWGDTNSYVLAENGFYYFKVKDVAGNVSLPYELCLSENNHNAVDSDTPVIEEMKYSIEHNGIMNMVYETIIAYDNTSRIVSYAYDADGNGITSSDWQTDNKFEIPFNRTLDENGRWFAVKDAAGNITKLKVYVNSFAPSETDMQEFIDHVFGSTKYQTPTKWVKSTEGVTIGFTLDPALVDENRFIAPEFRWNGADFGVYNESTSRKVIANGDYSVDIFRRLDGDLRGEKLGSISFTVSNIDNTAPTVSAGQSGSGRVSITAVDSESKIKSLSIKGNEYVDETFINSYDIPTARADEQVTVKMNGRYTIIAEDEAGNKTESPVYVSGNRLIEGTDFIKNIDPDSGWVSAEAGVRLSFDLSSMNPSKKALLHSSYKWSNEDLVSDRSITTVHANGHYSASIFQKAEDGSQGVLIGDVGYDVSNIDDIAPSVTLSLGQGGISVSAEDAQSGIKSVSVTGYEYGTETVINTYAPTRSSIGVTIPVSGTGSYVVNVIDGCGNVTHQSIVLEGSILDVNKDVITSMSPDTEWANGEHGVTLSFELDVQDEEILNKLYEEYRWSNESSLTTNMETTVHANGDYIAYIFQKNSLGERSGTAAEVPFHVTNIDKTPPSISAVPEDSLFSKTLALTISDGHSGVAKVYVKGQEYGTEYTLVKDKGNVAPVNDTIPYSSIISFPVAVNYNGTYTIKAVDGVGNEREKTVTITGLTDYEAPDIPEAPKTYNVIIAVEGTDKVLGMTIPVAEGDTVTLPAMEEPAGYVFDKFTSDDVLIGDGGVFTMPGGDVHVKAIYRVYQPTTSVKHSVVVSALNGSAGTMTGDAVSVGERVYLWFRANTGYMLSDITSDEVTVGSDYSFVMPNKDVRIHVNFVENSSDSEDTASYTVAVMTQGNGYAGVIGSVKLKAGDRGHLIKKELEGYKFDHWESDDVSIGNDDSFIMPGHNITIKACFVSISGDYTVTVESSAGGYSDVLGNNVHKEGDTVRLAQISEPGYLFVSYLSDDIDIHADGIFTMPAANVHVKALFVKRDELTLLPSTTDYTKDTVTITASVPPSIFELIAENGYSWDGGNTWGNSMEHIANENGAYALTYKLVNGIIFNTLPLTITNIDCTAPSLSIKQTDGVLVAEVTDDGSGILDVILVLPDGDRIELTPDETGQYVYELDREGNYRVIARDNLYTETEKEFSFAFDSTVSIVKIGPVEDVHIPCATLPEEILQYLPSTVSVLLSTGDLRDIAVEWNVYEPVHNTTYNEVLNADQFFMLKGDLVMPTDLVAPKDSSVYVDVYAYTVQELHTFSEEGTDRVIVTMPKKALPYTGYPITPAIKVTYVYEPLMDNGRKGPAKKQNLVENQDYTLSYEDNIHAGKGKIILKGISDYKGTITKEFVISKKPFSKLKAEMIPNVLYTGADLTDAIKDSIIVYDGTRRVDTSDYTVAFSKDPVGEEGVDTPISVRLTASEDGNYTGSLKKPLSVTILGNTAGKMDLSTAIIKVNLKKAIVYTGSAVKPSVEVMLNGKKVPSSGYTLVYEDNINAGPARVYAVGKGNYFGKTEAGAFNVLPRDLSNVKVSKLPRIAIRKSISELVPVLYNGKLRMKQGIDYDVTYADTSNITLLGITYKKVIISMTALSSNYTGSKNVSVTLIPRNIGSRLTTEVIVGDTSAEGNGNIVRPSVTVIYNGMHLVYGRDYTLSYKGGNAVGKKGTVTITGIGDYRGSRKVTYFVK